MTVDEILATGQYTDRRGRRWAKHTYYHGSVEWFHPLGNGACYINTLDEMRLLIERDLHRDECEGLQECKEHPVPYVWIGISGLPHHDPAWGFNNGHVHDTLPEAMDAARALAVGE